MRQEKPQSIRLWDKAVYCCVMEVFREQISALNVHCMLITTLILKTQILLIRLPHLRSHINNKENSRIKVHLLEYSLEILHDVYV